VEEKGESRQTCVDFMDVFGNGGDTEEADPSLVDGASDFVRRNGVNRTARRQAGICYRG
jgi:hypothetical protein